MRHLLSNEYFSRESEIGKKKKKIMYIRLRIFTCLWAKIFFMIFSGVDYLRISFKVFKKNVFFQKKKYCQVIAAEGEQKASKALREAAEVIAESPSALQA